MNKNISTFIACDADYDESSVVLFGAPFDGTTSNRPGTRFGPNAARLESDGLETYSPYFDMDLEDYKTFDAGDLEFCFGNKLRVLTEIKEMTARIIEDNKKPFMIGGEHLVTLGSVEALVEVNPDLHIIHLDAHTDLREEYLGERLSHATVLKRCYDLVGDKRIFQFGIRSGMKSEFEFAKNTGFLERHLTNLHKVVCQLKDKPVYITIDLDVLDPSIFAGTGTPEPGGITFNELLDCIIQFSNLNNIVGCDVVELAPQYDVSGVSNVVCAKVVREMTLLLHRWKL
ncbi:MAG: agmatinase [Mycoplasmatales bacterium]